MKEIKFKIQGSATDPYQVTFKKAGDNLTALCTCPAGEIGMYCKHRFGILEGSSKDIVSKNKGDVRIVQSWLPGSDVDDAMKEVLAADRQISIANNNLSKAKKDLARAMRD